VENALFYTFSTIAQTLAAAIAFLGAFALYRLQTIGVTLQDLSTSVIQPYLPDDKAAKLSTHERYGELNAYIQSVIPKNNGGTLNAYQVAQREAFAKYVESSQSVRFLLKVALAATVTVIVASVVVLAFTPAIASRPSATYSVFAVGLVALVGCLALHAYFVVKALR
jgi:hypothetical protein